MSTYIDREHFDQRIRAAVGMTEDELTEDFKDGVATVLELLKTEPTKDVDQTHGNNFDRHIRNLTQSDWIQSMLLNCDGCPAYPCRATSEMPGTGGECEEELRKWCNK